MGRLSLHRQRQLLHCTRLLVYRNCLSIFSDLYEWTVGMNCLYMVGLARFCKLVEHPFGLEPNSVRPLCTHFLHRLQSGKFYRGCFSLPKRFSLHWSKNMLLSFHSQHFVLFYVALTAKLQHVPHDIILNNMILTIVASVLETSSLSDRSKASDPPLMWLMGLLMPALHQFLSL